MKIFLNNFFHDLDLTFFYKLFEKSFSTKIEQSTLEDSDILFESVFGSNTLLYHKKWVYTILFIGESDRRLPLFMNRIDTLKDYSFILKGEHDHHNIINMPLFVLYNYAFNFVPDFIRYKDDMSFNNFHKIIPPKNVCVIVSSRDSEGRDLFCEELEKRIPIDYAGNYKNNVPRLEAHHSSPEFIKFVSQYKFIITMENSKNKTYITEKILHGFSANTIPVYWGSDFIGDYFNEERFIHVKSFGEKDMNDAIENIISLIKTPEKYIEIINKPIFKNNQHPFKIDDLASRIQKLLSLTPPETQNTFITFGGPTPNLHRSVNRICLEAKELDFFHDIIGYTESDLKQDESFWNQHGSFIEKNPRGYGYWLWKSYLIQKKLNQLKENDILIYCDAGCQINPYGKPRLFEYIELLNHNRENYGVLSFVLDYKEVQYTKQKIMDDFSVNPNQFQNLGGISIFKKNEHSIDIVNKWYETCCNYDYINDVTHHENSSFIENRHDQSIFSVLVNQYGSIKITDETYFHPNWDTKGKEYPFWAKRIK